MREVHAAAEKKAELFRVLGHPARVRILQLLAEEERNVGELQVALDLDSSATSQHLGTLRRQRLVEGRREGTNVVYRLTDPKISALLTVARQILTTSLEESRAVLDELAAEQEQEQEQW